MLQDAVRILLIDDDEDDFFIVSEYIKSIPNFNAKVSWCSKYEDAIEQIKGKNFDLYFTDYRLGPKTGIDLLENIPGNQAPVILLTGQGNYKIDMKAMALGAVDYLVKAELNAEKLERSIRYALERANTLKALRASERMYKGIFERSKDIIFIIDENLHFVEINEAVNNVLGYTVSECINKSMIDFITQAQHKKYLQQTLKSVDELVDWEVMLDAKDGEKKTCILNISKVADANGTQYMQGILHDITSLRKAEKSNLKSEKLAVASRLMHALAHEVRNPLNNITLSVEQLMDEQPSEAMLMYFNIISRNSKRINDIISELLNSSNPVEIALVPCVLQTVIDDTIAAAIDRLNLKNLKLQLDYPTEALYVRANKEQLSMALLNIVINAVEAMEEGKGILIVHLVNTNGGISLKIKDNGCGISEENLPRLFEPYFTQKRNGMGLGLALTLNILQAHGANVEVESELGKGSVFNITFPSVEVPVAVSN